MKAYKVHYLVIVDDAVVKDSIDTILVKDGEKFKKKAILRKNNLKGYQVDSIKIIWSVEVPLGNVTMNELNVNEIRLYLENFISNKMEA